MPGSSSSDSAHRATPAQRDLLQRSAALRQALQHQAGDEVARWESGVRRVAPWVAWGRRAVQTLRRPPVLAGVVAGVAVLGALRLSRRRPAAPSSATPAPTPAAAGASRLLGWALLGWRIWQFAQQIGRRDGRSDRASPTRTSPTDRW